MRHKLLENPLYLGLEHYCFGERPVGTIGVMSGHSSHFATLC
jgi:hypothetical protein